MMSGSGRGLIVSGRALLDTPSLISFCNSFIISFALLLFPGCVGGGEISAGWKGGRDETELDETRYVSNAIMPRWRKDSHVNRNVHDAILYTQIWCV